jgi:hypothetical protein
MNKHKAERLRVLDVLYEDRVKHEDAVDDVFHRTSLERIEACFADPDFDVAFHLSVLEEQGLVEVDGAFFRITSDGCEVIEADRSGIEGWRDAERYRFVVSRLVHMGPPDKNGWRTATLCIKVAPGFCVSDAIDFAMCKREVDNAEPFNRSYQ